LLEIILWHSAWYRSHFGSDERMPWHLHLLQPGAISIGLKKWHSYRTLSVVLKYRLVHL